VLHFLWLSKLPREPLLFGAVLLVLLALRLPPIKALLATLRPAPAPKREKPRETERV